MGIGLRRQCGVATGSPGEENEGARAYSKAFTGEEQGMRKFVWIAIVVLLMPAAAGGLGSASDGTSEELDGSFVSSSGSATSI